MQFYGEDSPRRVQETWAVRLLERLWTRQQSDLKHRTRASMEGQVEGGGSVNCEECVQWRVWVIICIKLYLFIFALNPESNGVLCTDLGSHLSSVHWSDNKITHHLFKAEWGFRGPAETLSAHFPTTYRSTRENLTHVRISKPDRIIWHAPRWHCCSPLHLAPPLFPLPSEVRVPS